MKLFLGGALALAGVSLAAPLSPALAAAQTLNGVVYFSAPGGSTLIPMTYWCALTNQNCSPEMVLWDGTNGVTVKPASTAPAGADTALVVGVSPNSPFVGTPGAAMPANGLAAGGWQSSTGQFQYFILDPTQALKVGFNGAPQPMNVTQQAGQTLAAPTAPGTPATSGLVSTVNIANAGTASVATFTPVTILGPLSATTGGATLAGLTAGQSLKAINTGASATTCSFGATDSGHAEYLAAGGGSFIDTVPPAVTQLTCTAASGTNVINLLEGTGLGAMTGGGGAGGSLTWPGTAAASSYGTSPSGTAPGVNAAVTSSVLPSGAATAANQEVTAAGTSAASAQAFQGVAGGVPMASNLAQVAGTPLGAPTAWGTAPGAGNFPNVNVNCVTGCSGSSGAPVTPAGTSATSAMAIQGVTGGLPLNVNLGQTSGASIPINISTATTTQLVAAVSGQSIYVTHWDVIAGGSGNLTFEYGTGSNCGTGTTALTGVYPLIAQDGEASGDGLGTILIVPPGAALCAVTSANVQMSGSMSYTQK